MSLKVVDQWVTNEEDDDGVSASAEEKEGRRVHRIREYSND
jgi:hypothetical protein